MNLIGNSNWLRVESQEEMLWILCSDKCYMVIALRSWGICFRRILVHIAIVVNSKKCPQAFFGGTSDTYYSPATSLSPFELSRAAANQRQFWYSHHYVCGIEMGFPLKKVSEVSEYDKQMYPYVSFLLIISCVQKPCCIFYDYFL